MLRRLLLAFAIVAGAIGVGGGPVDAWPTNCSTWRVSPGWISGKCTSGSGSYFIRGTCARSPFGTRAEQGSTKYVPNTAHMVCDQYWTAISWQLVRL